MADTKKIWKDVVTADDYDAHMVEAGQALICAEFARKMLQEYPLSEKSLLYVPGAGTGQMFEFLRPQDLGNLRYLFSDIKPEFLEKLKSRLPQGTDFQSLVDDLEESKMEDKTDAALIVLLLQHIDWRRALNSIIFTNPKYIYLVEQEQDTSDQIINRNRQLRPTIKKFSELAKTELISRVDLESYLRSKGYNLVWLKIEQVPFQKRLFSMVYEVAKGAF